MLGKMGHFCGVKWVILKKVGHTWNNGSHLDEAVQTKEKWVTFGKMGQTLQNESH